MAILEVKDLEVYYGVIQAIKGISFEVNQGEIIALIGANGAGKTTTLQTITGLIPSKAGTITYEGQDSYKIPGYKRGWHGNRPCAGGTPRICRAFRTPELKAGGLYQKRQKRDGRNPEDDLRAFSASGRA